VQIFELNLQLAQQYPRQIPFHNFVA
jgi:hypothetical protein